MKEQPLISAVSSACAACLNRRTVLKSGAVCLLSVAFSEGCVTSEPLNFGTSGAGGDGGSSGTGGIEDAGVAGTSRDSGAGGEGGRGGGGGGDGVAGAGPTDAREDGNAGAGGGTGGRSGAGGGGGAAGSSPGTCPGAVVAGKASTVSLGSLVMVATGLVVGRDAAGLYAMSAFCTHQGCATRVVGAASQETLYCPCHGSAFSGTGAVTRGPARSPLQHYQLEVSASGDLTVCVDISVASTTRTAG
jgi:Rieske Fe-S protein